MDPVYEGELEWKNWRLTCNHHQTVYDRNITSLLQKKLLSSVILWKFIIKSEIYEAIIGSFISHLAHVDGDISDVQGELDTIEQRHAEDRATVVETLSVQGHEPSASLLMQISWSRSEQGKISSNYTELKNETTHCITAIQKIEL